MMKVLFKAIILLSFYLGLYSTVYGSHATGLDLQYVCLGNNQYLVTLRFYRDCDGIGAPTAPAITYTAPGCNTGGTLTLTQQSFQEISPLCQAQIGQSTCNGGNLPGFEEYVYTGTLTLPASCSNWRISFAECCRNDAVTNLQTPGSFDLYAEAIINNTNGLCNNSPQFTSLPVPYFCSGIQANYNHGTIDVDGDSLVYTLINPLDAANTPIPYVTGYNPNNPMELNGTWGFNTSTGQMSFNPDGAQNAVVTILVSEYRNGVFVGSTMRDIQIIIIPCSNTPPTISQAQNVTGAQGFNPQTNTILACPGSNISFTFTVTDPNQTNVLTVTDNSAQVAQGISITYTTISSTNILGTLTWIPTGNDTGSNVITVTATDAACPIVGTTIVSFNIDVLDGTTASPDESYCIGGAPVQLSAVGGTSFTWTPAAGLDNPNIQNPLASPTQTTTYIVTSNLANNCGNTDTVVITLVPPFSYVLNNQADTVDICRNGLTQIDIVPDPSGAPYTFSWTPPASLSNPSIADPIAAPQNSTTYQVEVISALGCKVVDSVRVNIIGVGPLVEIVADNNNVCPGDTVNLDLNLYPLSCGQTLSPCNAQNPPSPKTLGASTVASAGETPYDGSSDSRRYQMLFLASDLQAAGLQSGTISRIAMDIATKGSNNVFQNFTIKMGCTDVTSLSVNDGWIPAPTQVFSSAGVSTTVGFNNNYNLNPQYDWDGVSNIVVEICFTTPTAGAGPGGIDQVNTNTTSYVSAMKSVGGSAGSNGCSLAPAFTYNQLPNIRFFSCNALTPNYTFNWTPATGLSDPTIRDPFAIVTQNSITYTVTVADTQCAGGDFITLVIDTSYGISVTEDTAVCGIDSIQLNVSVTGNPPTSSLPCGSTNRQCGTTNLFTIGTGFTSNSSTDYPAPYGHWYESTRQQYLYRAADLLAAGLTSGTLTSLAFNVTAITGTTQYFDFTIRLSCTNQTELNDVAFLGGLTQVFNPKVVNVVNGWNTHVFDNTFNWDGVSNIVVDICFDNDTYLSTFTNNSSTTLTAKTYEASAILISDNAGSLCNSDTGPFGQTIFTDTNLPNIRFNFCPAPTGTTSIAWSPNYNISDTTIANPVVFPDVPTTYYVSYTFINGCTRVDSVTVNITGFTATVTDTILLCAGDSAQIFASGGTSYFWDQDPELSCFTCPNPIATPLETKYFYVTVSDSSTGCVTRDSVLAIVNPGSSISIPADTLCFINQYVLDAGSGFVSYLWNTQSTSQAITVTQPGVYSVTVVDQFGCTTSDSTTLLVNIPPVINLGNDTAICQGALVLLDPGSNFVTYEWSTGQNGVVSISVGTADEYSVTVTDANNCPAFDTIEVEVDGIAVDLGPDEVYCSSEEIILVAGPLGNSYIWQDGSVAPTYQVTTPGVYSVTATTSNGCSDADTVTIGLFPDQPLDIGNPQQVICAGQSITLSAPGYSLYSWSPGNQTTSSITVTQAGTYSLTATDVNGCTYTDAVQITVDQPTVSLGSDVSLCDGGTAVLDAGNGFDAYIWSPNLQTTSSISVTQPGLYSVTVTNANGCTASDAINVLIGSPLTPDLGNDLQLCAGADVSLYPGDFDEYLWSDGTTDETIDVTSTGTFSVTVTNNGGCSATDSISITILEPIEFDDVTSALCADGITTLSAPPGYESYLWSDSTTNQTLDVNSSGTYSVTVTGVSGCTGVLTIVVSDIVFSVSATADPSQIDVGQSTTLGVNANGSGSYDFEWVPSEFLNDAAASNPVATLTETTEFTVTVQDDITGCLAIDTILIEVGSNVDVPRAFSPNGDGKNDEFYPILTGVVDVKVFRVYNRWGELLHDDPSSPWDGRYKGKAQPVSTYVFYAEVVLSTGEEKVLNDAFSLFR